MASRKFPFDLLTLVATFVVSQLIGVLLICVLFGILVKSLGSASADANALFAGLFILPAVLMGFGITRFGQHHLLETAIAAAALMGGGYVLLFEPPLAGLLGFPLVLLGAWAGHWLRPARKAVTAPDVAAAVSEP